MISNDNPRQEPGPHDGSLEKMEGAFQALGSEIRLRILIFLAQGSRAAGEVAAQFDISKPAVSKHLGILEQAGLVTSRRKGQFVYYSLTGGQVAGVFKQYLQLLNRTLPLEQRRHFIVTHGIAEFLVDLIEFLEQIDCSLDPLLDDLPDRFRIIQPRLLFEKPDGVAWREHRLTDKLLIDSGEDPE